MRVLLMGLSLLAACSRDPGTAPSASAKNEMGWEHPKTEPRCSACLNSDMGGWFLFEMGYELEHIDKRLQEIRTEETCGAKYLLEGPSGLEGWETVWNFWVIHFDVYKGPLGARYDALAGHAKYVRQRTVAAMRTMNCAP